MTWSPADDFLVSGDAGSSQAGSVLKVWSPSLSEVKAIPDAHGREPVTGISCALCFRFCSLRYSSKSPQYASRFAPVTSKFATSGADKNVKVWDLGRAQTERTLRGHGDEVKCVAWHPAKGLVASGGRDNAIKLWDPRADGPPIITLCAFVLLKQLWHVAKVCSFGLAC